jgi:hypothetical protein
MGGRFGYEVLVALVTPDAVIVAASTWAEPLKIAWWVFEVSPSHHSLAFGLRLRPRLPLRSPLRRRDVAPVVGDFLALDFTPAPGNVFVQRGHGQ